jgi:hypothetical protein
MNSRKRILISRVPEVVVTGDRISCDLPWLFSNMSGLRPWGDSLLLGQPVLVLLPAGADLGVQSPEETEEGAGLGLGFGPEGAVDAVGNVFGI